MLSRCVMKWWELSLADYPQLWQGITTRALIYSFMLWAQRKGEFFRSKNMNSISRCEWKISVRAASCTSKLLRFLCAEKLCKKTFYSAIELIYEFTKQWNESLTPTLSSSSAKCSACSFKSESVFSTVNKSRQKFLSFSFVERCRNNFHQRQRATNVNLMYKFHTAKNKAD